MNFERTTRTHYRIRAVDTNAVCSQRRFMWSYEVQNLSIGGALLRKGPRIDVGQVVKVTMLSRRGEIIRAAARVVRHHSDTAGGGIGVAFERVDATTNLRLRRLIDELRRANLN